MDIAITLNMRKRWVNPHGTTDVRCGIPEDCVHTVSEVFQIHQLVAPLCDDP